MFGQDPNSVVGSSPPLYNCYRLNNMASGSRSSSPATRSMPSGRKGSKKVRTGCVTCKIRKVKCDETKPFCLRCTKTGRKCDGYLDPRALTKKRGHRDSAPHDHVLGPLFDFAAPEEKRAFWFFQHFTAPCISGDFDADFWRVIVLQISQTEPAVRHAVLAVSSLHEGLGACFSDSALSQPQQSFALQQYNKAIARLLEQMNNPLTKPLASLLTCVLFVCIEYMQGKDKESLIHLEQGRQLLTQLNQRSNDPEMECIVRHIVPLYTRLSLTSFLFGGSPVPIPDALKSRSDIPATFDSIDSMRHCMHEFMEQAFRFTQRARPAKNPDDSIPRETMGLLEIEQDRLLSRLAKLNVAFALFRASRSNPSPENALLVLQMYLHAQHIWISTALSSSEVVYDDFLASFAAIVPLAAAYLDLELSSQHRSLFPPQSSLSIAVPEQLATAYTSNFTFETHIIPPLYYVAIKCRHPLIRRSALELLRRNPSRRENLWRASVMGALAGHIVSLEEQWSQRQCSPEKPGSISNTSIDPRNDLNYDTPPEQMMTPRTQSRNVGLYSTCIGADQTIPMGPISSNSFSMPSLGFETPMERSLPLDMKVSSSLSHPPSLTASADDSHSSSSIVEPTLAFFTLHSDNNTWSWQHQYQQQQQQQQSHQCMSYGSVGCSSHSGTSSDISSVDFEEQRRYQAALQIHSPSQQYPNQQVLQQHTPSRATSTEALHQHQCEPLPTNLITEAPFGLPEELRVHEAVLGPEREDGTWVAVFRKLHGVHANWDVQNDWVATV